MPRQHDDEESFKLKKNCIRLIPALLAVMLLPLAAPCQIVLDRPPAERPANVRPWTAFAGYSYTSLNQINQSRWGLQGVDATATRDFGRYFSLVADGSYYFKTVACCNPVDVKVYMGLAGPGFHMDLFGPLSLFGHALIGVAHTQGGGMVPDISFAGGIGGGMEYKLSSRLSLRASGDDILSSFAEDPNHLGISPNRRGNSRAAFGPVYRF